MKFKYSSKSEIPAGLESFYKEVNGAWVLQVEGAVESDRLSEFRDSNIALKKQLEAFAGIDPVAVRKAQQDAENARQEALKKEGKIDELVSAQIAPYKTQIDGLTGQLKQKEQEYAGLLMKTEVLALAPKFKVRASAIEDLTFRAGRVFHVEGGKLTAKDPMTGQPMLSTKNPGTPLSADEWFENLSKQAPHLFEASSGGGAAGSGGGATTGGKNPWAKGQVNLSEQIKITKENPALAQQLKASAA